MSAAMSIALRTIASASSGPSIKATGGGQRVVAAGADARHAGLGLEHVAGAGEHPATTCASATIIMASSRRQVAVGAPVLGELDRGRRVSWPGVLLELGFQPLEQGEGVGGGAGKAADSRRPCRDAAPSWRWP